MLLYILDDKTIRLTRGDTAYLTIPLFNDSTQSDYEMSANDVLTFSVKRKPKTDIDCLIQKIIHGSNTFHIEPGDTKDMSFGKYRYDVQLTTAGGDVYTVIEPSVFEVMEEVTT